MSNSTAAVTTSSTSIFSTSSFVDTSTTPSSSASSASSSIPVTSSTHTSATVASTSTTPATSSSADSTSPTTTAASKTSVTAITSRITITPTTGSGSPSVITVTSTETPASGTTDSAALASASKSSAAAASSSSRAAALATSDASSHSSGLSSGGKIAIAVVVPIVAIAAIVIALLFFWKRHKARKDAEEERRREAEEYGYNPNNDPTLPAVGSAYGENGSEMQEDNSGYRGWGATSSTQRKPSTTLGSGRGPVGMAVSDTTSNGGYGHQSEGNSGDPLVSDGNERPVSGEDGSVGALGTVPAAGAQNRDINRGPSNASSAYTGHAQSEASEEGDRSPNGGYAHPYYDEGTYYNEAQPQHGPFGDGSYSSGQPVIRDVQARRNTRIEKPSVFPQQGNAGISQNF